MGFIIPFVAVMFDQNGLTATQIAICMMTQQAVVFITEIPSGAIADRYSRKNVLIAAQLITFIAYAFWILMPHFWGYCLGYVCWGIRGSFMSGTMGAFLYDELKKYDKRSLYEKVKGRSDAFRSAGILIASLIASYLAKKGFDFNFLMIGSIITTLISTSALFSISPAKKAKDTDEIKSVLSYMQILKKGIKYSYRHTTIFKLILFSAFTLFINIGFLEYSEIFYNELTNDLAKVAIIFGLMEIMYITGSLTAEWFKKIPVRFLVLFYCLVACFDIAAFTLYKYPISLAIVFFDTLVICGVSVNTDAKTNDFIPSRVRATILSVKGFVTSIGMFITLFFFGKVVDYFKSYQVGFLTFSRLFAIGAFVFFVVLWKDKHLRKREGRLKRQS